VLFSSNPAHSYGDGLVGMLDFHGAWLPVKAEFPMDTNTCRRGLAAISEHRLITYSCGDFAILDATGKPLFSVQDLQSVFKAAAAGGSELVVRRDRYFVERIGNGGASLATRPDRLEVYDLESHERRTSIPVQTDQVSYAVSERGDLAVVDGDALCLYGTEN